MPALLNAASRRPNSWTVACTAALTSPLFVTSQGKGSADPPRSEIRRAVSAVPASSMSTTATAAPAPAKASAVARPIPLDAPVTNATLFANVA